ncbi:MAG: hypothetical protein JNL02_02685 [Saprospiraceae bacterium]|nr:hypothetical protein [Saprospiraceae bacterium]
MGSTKATLITGGGRLRYEKTVKKLKAEVILGSPNAGCSGVGICRVMAATKQIDCPCPSVTTWVGITESGRVQFAFIKSAMDEKMIRRHFRWALFQVLEAYEMPLHITRYLKSPGLLIEPGIYTVWDTPDRLIVEF